MNSFLLILMISLMSVRLTLQAAIKDDPKGIVNSKNDNVKTLDYKNSVQEIVKDLISTWTSPLVYLKNRGYLRGPQIGFDMLLSNDMNDSKDVKKNVERVARSSADDEETPNDLGHLFRTLFSTSDDVDVSNQIKSKMGVPWDMKALKTTVRNEVSRFYEKFYDKHNKQAVSKEDGEIETEIDREVAHLYPSVVDGEKEKESANEKEKDTEKEKKAISSVKTALKQPKVSQGLAKLLTVRVKPLVQQQQQQEQLKEQKAPNPST
ncbi:uncharacterized protein LOC6578654 [Drosophila mojavensis]|uniref:Uncharacterized protein n=1 Tax=Drosophila mojavensis TaxID=7230 RepID=B4KTD6_DROMO|nr:uncharacterized protein LOC6578654 [Drosophila mojavensis]EDW08497.1 uncharacterized protein Dmoj_GI19541 [Drosophila mojavensis]